MSTSSNASTAIHYMQETGRNVLWELTPKTETDAGFHHGADISLLSQFREEAENLFPPCTMLQVVNPQSHEDFRRIYGFGSQRACISFSRSEMSDVLTREASNHGSSVAGVESQRTNLQRGLLIRTPSYQVPSGLKRRARSRWHQLVYQQLSLPL